MSFNRGVTIGHKRANRTANSGHQMAQNGHDWDGHPLLASRARMDHPARVSQPTVQDTEDMPSANRKRTIERVRYQPAKKYPYDLEIFSVSDLKSRTSEEAMLRTFSYEFSHADSCNRRPMCPVCGFYFCPLQAQATCSYYSLGRLTTLEEIIAGMDGSFCFDRNLSCRRSRRATTPNLPPIPSYCRQK